MKNYNKSSFSDILEESQKFEKYDLGEGIESISEKLRLKPSDVLKLNSNENLFIPLNFLRGLLLEVANEVDPRLYPMIEVKQLKEALSTRLKILPEMILLGSGSDQLIELLCMIFLRPGDEALSIDPTFSMYRHGVMVQKAKYVSVPLKRDFTLDYNNILASITHKTKIIFLCSPNNPTANQFKIGEIRKLSEEFKGIVVVDEAYADFADESIVDQGFIDDNLIVLRTFSKAFGLAGLRLGYAVSNKEIVQVIEEKFKMPYNVSNLSLRMGVKILENSKTIEKAIIDLKAERTKLIRDLNSIKGIEAFGSQTNFILFKVEKSSDEVYKNLLNRGVVVRNIGQVLQLANCLRVTVPPPNKSKRLLLKLREAISVGNA